MPAQNYRQCETLWHLHIAHIMYSAMSLQVTFKKCLSAILLVMIAFFIEDSLHSITIPSIGASFIDRPSTFVAGSIFYFLIAESGQTTQVTEYCLNDLDQGSSAVAPSDLNTTDIERNSFTANWTLPTFEIPELPAMPEMTEKLQIRLRVGEGDPVVTMLATADTSRVFTGLDAQENYQWGLRLITDLRSSGWSEYQSINTLPPLARNACSADFDQW